MNSRSLFVLFAISALALGCSRGEDRINVQQTQAVGVLPDTLPPAPQVPGAAGSSAPAPPVSATAAPATAAAPQTPPAPAGLVIVDVRTQQEYDAGHVQGAILIPYDQMEQRWQELQQYRDQPLLLYCRSGRRSGIAIDVLKSKGFTQLENGGGIDAMAGRGFRITTD